MDAAWIGASNAAMQVSARTPHIAHARFAMRHTPDPKENGSRPSRLPALAHDAELPAPIFVAQPCKYHQRIERRKPHSVKAVKDEIIDRSMMWMAVQD